MSIILAAARLAAYHHKSQKRNNNGRPYLTHLIRVAGRVATLKGAKDEDVAAGFLHDLLEDVPKSPEDFELLHNEIFIFCGRTALEIVVALTNPSKGKQLPRADRKKIDREHLLKCPIRVKRIKLVDRIDNLLESASDILIGCDTNVAFNKLYADESELLLNEALLNTDSDLEQELVDAISLLRSACEDKTTAVVT